MDIGPRFTQLAFEIEIMNARSNPNIKGRAVTALPLTILSGISV